MFLIFLILLNLSCKKDAVIPVTEDVANSAPALNSDENLKLLSLANLSEGESVDNRASLQKTINEYASKKQTLKLPSGKFFISDEIIIPSNTTIEGSGDLTEIILTPGNRSGRNVFRIPTRTTNVRFKNFKLNANQAANSGADLVSLYVTDNVNTLYCENMNFAGGRDRGAVQIKGLNDYPVSNLSFYSCKFSEAGRTSLELRGTQAVIINKCVFSNWGKQNPNSPAIQLQSQNNYDIKITQNTFNNKYGVQFAIECAAAYVFNSLIDNNKFNDEPNLGGNGISGYYKSTKISNNTFTGGNGNQRSGLEIFGQNNTLSDNTILAGGIAIAPGLNEDGSGVVISHNYIKTRGTNSAGIQMGNGSKNLNNIKVVNNTVDTRLATGNSSAIVVGTYESPRVVTDITVESNTLYTNAHCIRLQSLDGSKNIYLLRNICKAGYSWLGIITNTFTNIQAIGNSIEFENKAISYSVPMAPVVVK